MPVAIKFGTKTEKIEQKRESVDPEDKEETYKTVEVDNIINNPNPAWTNYQLNYQMKTIKLLP
jgi:molecular chaperone HtpG